jgi:hypothetical protein
MNTNRMIRCGALLVAGLAGLLGPEGASGQTPVAVTGGSAPRRIAAIRDRLPRAVPSPAYHAGGHWGGGNFVGTAQSAALHGQADVLRSIGQRNLLNAEARRSLEEARDRALDNSLKTLEIRQERQRLGRARIAEEQQQRRAARDRARYLREGSRSPTDPEAVAASRLTNALNLLDRGQRDDARKWLARLTAEFPRTEAAGEAADLLAALR